MKVFLLIFYLGLWGFLNTADAQNFKDVFLGQETITSGFTSDAKTQSIILHAPGIENAKSEEGYYFVYTEVAGDFRFSANMNSFKSGDSENRIGLMVRNSLDINSAFGEIGTKDSLTTRVFRQRDRSGFGGAKKRCLLDTNPDYFVLERKADTVFYKVSTDGEPLRLYGINIMSLKDTVLVGMYLKSDIDVQENQADFRNVKLEKLNSED